MTLDKENPTITWSFDEEEDDTDFLIHTLFLKQVRKFDANTHKLFEGLQCFHLKPGTGAFHRLLL